MTEPQKLGVIDFINLIYNGHPEYSLIAVKAPLEKTIQAYITISQNRKTRERFDFKSMRMNDLPVTNLAFNLTENIPVRESKKGDMISRHLAFLSINGTEWTVILRSLFIAKDELYDVPVEIKALSIELQTKVIYLIEEDTSSAIGYELFENGEQLEYFEEACNDDFSFESKLREKPDIKFHDWDEDDSEEEDAENENNEDNLESGYDSNKEPRAENPTIQPINWDEEDSEEDELDEDAEDEDDEDDSESNYDCSKEPRVQFVDAFFRELGIYLPACYAVHEQGVIAVEKSSLGMIARADLLSITYELKVKVKEHNPDDDE